MITPTTLKLYIQETPPTDPEFFKKLSYTHFMGNQYGATTANEASIPENTKKLEKMFNSNQLEIATFETRESILGFAAWKHTKQNMLELVYFSTIPHDDEIKIGTPIIGFVKERAEALNVEGITAYDTPYLEKQGFVKKSEVSGLFVWRPHQNNI